MPLTADEKKAISKRKRAEKYSVDEVNSQDDQLSANEVFYICLKLNLQSFFYM